MSLISINVNVGVFLDCVLFPLTFTELLDTLEKNGYVLSPSIPVVRPLSRFRGSGHLGVKGKNIFQVDAGDKSLIVIGPSLNEVQTEFSTFCSTLLEDYSINIDEITQFYQYSGNYEVKTDKNPYQAISTAFKNDTEESISDILGAPVKTYAVRFATSESLPKDIDWFDLKITPDIQRNEGYIIEIVYRNQDKEKYQTFTERFETNILQILKTIEG